MIQKVSGTILIPAGETTVELYLGTTVTGRIHAIKYEPGTLATGADLTITGEDTEVPILIKANAGTSTVWWYPRAFPNQNTDAAAETDAREDIHVLDEQIKVAVAQAVAAQTGTITVYFDTPSPY